MGYGRWLAGLVALFVASCASTSVPLKDMVGYVPPTSLPAQPKRTLVADDEQRVWSQLVAFLEASAFEIDHIDAANNLLVARYSGDPEPYIDCGSIVTHQGGALDQIAGSASTIALNYELEKEPVILNRSLNLDSRIIIRLIGQAQGTVISTDTTYVVTKIVDVTDRSGGVREGSRETVSFQAGDRGEFSKGTACQPNGSLDLAVLQSLPNIVGSDEIDRAELADDHLQTSVTSTAEDDPVAALPKPDTPSARSRNTARADTQTQPAPETARSVHDQAAKAAPFPAPADLLDDWVLPEQGLPSAALPAPDRSRGSAKASPVIAETSPTVPKAKSNASPRATSPTNARDEETAALLPNDPIPDDVDRNDASPTSIVDDTSRTLLDSLDCQGDEWHFCDLVKLTTPYRKRNIEELFGLTINTTESFTSQVIGSDLKLDILFPSFPAHLHIAYARRDGTIAHIMSSSDRWPANLTHQVAEEGQSIPGPSGLAMIIAIASDRPLFSSPPANAEEATVYLGRLKQHLAAYEAENPDGSIAASQLLIYVENAET